MKEKTIRLKERIEHMEKNPEAGEELKEKKPAMEKKEYILKEIMGPLKGNGFTF